jgi:hypothetical protein
VPDPGQKNTVTLVPDDGSKSIKVTYTDLEMTLMHVQDEVYAYANSFYWLDYKSYLEPSPVCDFSESMLININNNSSNAAGKNVSGKFESCNYTELYDGMIYVNSKVTNPAGITGDIDLQYVMLGDVPILDSDSIYPLEAFTYEHKNTPAYEWLVSNQNIVRLTVDPRSYANSRATLSLPENKQDGSTFLNVTDTGNGGVFRRFTVNVEGTYFPAPIAYYPFNGNADDETGNGYDGEAFGATLTTDRNGNANRAYSFDGTNDYIALDMFYGSDSGAVSETINEITVCVWVKSSSIKKDQFIVSFDRSEYWRLALRDSFGTEQLGWDTRDAAIGQDDLRSTMNYADGQWHFICSTYDANAAGDNKKVFVDGVEVLSTRAHDGGVLGSGVVRYGFIGTGSEASTYNGPRAGGNNSAVYLQGLIDDVIIFDLALSQSQIATIYQSIK